MPPVRRSKSSHRTRPATNVFRRLWKQYLGALSLRGKKLGRGAFNVVFECKWYPNYVFRRLWKQYLGALSLRGKKLGRGAFNVVFECKWYPNYVLREPLGRIDAEDREDEARGQHDVDRMPPHCNLLQQPGPQVVAFLRTLGVLLPHTLVLPRMNDELQTVYTKLCTKKGMDWPSLSLIMRGVLRGVAHLHRHNRVHLDLKPQNIMIQWNGATRYDLKDPRVRVKVVDYGFLETIGHTSEGRGSEGYKAPEQDEDQCVHKASADVYSLGVLISELALRPPSAPWRFVRWCEDRRKDPAMVARDLKALPGWTAAAARTVAQCWHTDEARRPTVAELQALF